ncbi:MAG: hypothetical protein K6F74_05315 [Prevotella sp.]|nr:hypothetical protein [Prevotella sp.]
MTDRGKDDHYRWWDGPVTLLMFTLWFFLMLIGVAMPIAVGINAVFVFGFWIILSSEL